jgi:hypothetical protein
VANGSGTAGLDYLAKANVTLQGSGMPQVAANRARLVDGSGTIVAGPLYLFASGLTCRNFGVDSGLDVCSTYYGATAQDGFAHLQINQAGAGTALGNVIDKIIGLCKASNSPVHAVLLEAMDGLWVGHVRGVQGIHGVVLKVQNSSAELLEGIYNDTNNVILKSDVYAPCNSLQVGAVRGTSSADSCLRIQAATASMTAVNVGSVLASGGAVAGVVFDGTSISSDCRVDEVSVYGSGAGVRRVNQTRGCSVGRCVVSNATAAGYLDVSGINTYPFTFDSLECLNCAAGVNTNGLVVIGTYASTATTSWDINYTATIARVLIGTTRRLNPGKAPITNLNPTLNAGWTAIGGQSPFDVKLDGYGVRLQGLISPGSGTMFTLPPNMCPSVNVQVAIHGWSSTTTAAVPAMLLFPPSGAVSIQSQPAAINAWYSLDGLMLPGTYL